MTDTEISSKELLNEVFGRIGKQFDFEEGTADFATFGNLKLKWTRNNRWITFDISDFLKDAPENVLEEIATAVLKRIMRDTTPNYNKDAKGDYLKSEKKVTEAFETAGVREIQTLHINIYDFNGIVNRLMKVGIEERMKYGDVRFHVNFTSGTRIMSGAMVCASMMIDAELCYVHDINRKPTMTIDQQILRIQPANLVDINNLTKTEKDIFIEIGDAKDGKANGDLVKANRAKSTLTSYTKTLEKMGLIKGHINGREKKWFLTEKGTSAYTIMSHSRIRSEPGKKGTKKSIVSRKY